jgi:hypothetical protein
MKTQRAGTNRRIQERLAEHAARMKAYLEQGLSKEDASRRAREDLGKSR